MTSFSEKMSFGCIIQPALHRYIYPYAEYYCAIHAGRLNFALPIAISSAGQRFALREGGRTVGAGVVSKVLS